MLATLQISSPLPKGMDESLPSLNREPQPLRVKQETQDIEGDAVEDAELAKPSLAGSPTLDYVDSHAGVADDAASTYASSDKAVSPHADKVTMVEDIPVVASPNKEDDMSPTISQTSVIDDNDPKQFKDDGDNSSSISQYVDRFDTENDGDVVKYFFTSDTRNRPLSPVQEHDCINLQFHDDSDLYIKAKGADGTLYVFEVHSGLLAATSPVFYEMVYSTHTRGNKEEWMWDLDDSPIGLRAIFSILHHKFQAAMFMYNPKPEQIYDVLAVLDKYGISDRVFHPLAKGWAEVFREGADHTNLEAYQLVFVACKLGDIQMFNKYLRRVAQEVELVDGALIFHGDKKLQELMPASSQVLETIKSIRINEIERLLAVLKDAYEFLIDDSKIEKSKYCKSVDHHSDCHQKLLGSLLSSLVRKKLYPFTTAEGFKGSVKKLANDVGSMEIRGLYLPGLEPHKQLHGNCRLDVDAALQEIVRCEVQSPLPIGILEELYLASKRIGTFKDNKPEFQTYKKQMAEIISLRRLEFSCHVRGWKEQAGETDVESLFSEDE